MSNLLLLGFGMGTTHAWKMVSIPISGRFFINQYGILSRSALLLLQLWSAASSSEISMGLLKCSLFWSINDLWGGVSERYKVRIIILVTIVFMKVICKSFRGILWRCYFFLVVEEDIKVVIEFIASDGVYFIPYDVWGEFCAL